MDFTQKDIAKAQERGIGLEQLNEQLENFRRGFPYARLVRAATVGDGIERLSAEQMAEARKAFENCKSQLTIEKFVPASGAASRMFKDLYDFVEHFDAGKHRMDDFPKAKQVVERVEEFAFAEELDSILESEGTSLADCKAKGDYVQIVRAILSPEGLDYGQNPKALILFHRYGCELRTALEEHLVEAALYCKDNENKASLYFTLSPAHFAKARKLIDRVLPKYEQLHNLKYSIRLGSQQASTDTISVSNENTPVRDENGDLVFRPSGHGALIENLQETDADIVFIKNIDNVSTDRVKQAELPFKQMLGGMLAMVRSKVHSALRNLEAESVSAETLEEIVRMCREDLRLEVRMSQEFESPKAYRDYLFALLHRPIRVCAMVKNEGQPGGGPFFVENAEGEVSLQIVEKAQIDLTDPEQERIFSSSTHFNPVDIVCSIKDHKGEKYSLKDFVDSSMGFISFKTRGSETIKVQERPGLWNGAMAGWLTLFVETPIEFFNPVKTINDLLQPAHRA